MASLRTQTSLVTFLTMIGMVGSLFAVLDRAALNQFNRIEQKLVADDIQYARDSLEASRHALQNVAAEKAVDDGAVRFMTTRDNAYLQTAVTRAELAGADVSLIMFFRPDGTLLYSTSFDRDTEKEMPLPPRLIEQVRAHPPFLSRSLRTRGAAGVVVLPDAIVMLASHPILYSDLGGPAAGTLVMGRLLNEAEVQRIARNFQSPFRLLRREALGPNAPEFGKEGVATRILERNVIEAFGLVRDVFGQPSLCLGIQKPREISKIGMRFAIGSSILIMMIMLVGAVMQIILLNHRVLSRLTRLGARMSEISQRKDVSLRLPETGDDELSRLARDINQMLTMVDVTQARLRESEGRLNTILQSIQDGVMVVDGTSQQVLGANVRALQLLGLNRDQAMGAPARQFFQAIDSDAWPFGDDWTASNVEARLVCANQTTIPILLSALPVRIEGRRCHVVSFADIREEKHMQEALARARDQAESANRAKSMFLANMSHEIRTPMNAVLGFAQLLHQDSSLTASQRQSVRTILHSGEHLLSLINSILEMSKIESGSVATVHRAFRLSALLDDLEIVLRSHAVDKGIQFKIVRCSDVPLYLVTDDGKLRQMLVNLLGNAIKFTERGQVVLRVSAHSLEGNHLHLICEVEDTGPGIEPKDQERIFLPFQQTRAGIEARGGTGLGLAISREYAHLLQGDITVTSEPGHGSTFRLDLPVEFADAIESDETVLPTLGRLRDEESPRILNVDDEEANRLLVTHMLSQVGFDVRPAASGREALDLLASWHPALVILDLSMPDIDGYEVLKRMRLDPATRDVPVIVLTAHAFEEDRRRTMEAGANGFVRKPFRVPELLETIGRLLNLKYENELRPTKPAGAAGPVETASGHLPAPLLERLREAARLADVEQLEALAPQVMELNPAIGLRLKALMERYEYGMIHDMCVDPEVQI